MSPSSKKNKKSRKGKSKQGRGVPPSSDMAVSAGRGKSIPRANLGHDTLLGLAQSQRRTLALAAGVSITTGGGTYVEGTLPLNDAYNGGTSPVGYAKYMAFYSKCFVIGARIKVHGNLISTNGHTAAIGLTVTTNSTSLGGAGKAVENGMCDWVTRFIEPDHFVLNQAVDVSKFLNKPRVLDDPQLFSTSAASPTQLIVAHYWAQSIGAVVAIWEGQYEIEYDCVFTDPIPFT